MHLYPGLILACPCGPGAGTVKQCPVSKLHVVDPPPSPQPSPPEAGGEGVGQVAGFLRWQGLKSVPAFSRSPNGGEGQGEGDVVFLEQKVI